MEHQSGKISWLNALKSMPGMTPEITALYEQALDKQEKFVPDEVLQLLPEDFVAMQETVALLEEEVRHGVTFNNHFINLLRKIQQLIAENHPDFFDSLDGDIQKSVIEAKLHFATEEEVAEGIFDYLNGQQEYSGSPSIFTFDEKVKYLMKYNELSQRIARVFEQYDSYFRENRSTPAS